MNMLGIGIVISRWGMDSGALDYCHLGMLGTAVAFCAV